MAVKKITLWQPLSLMDDSQNLFWFWQLSHPVSSCFLILFRIIIFILGSLYLFAVFRGLLRSGIVALSFTTVSLTDLKSTRSSICRRKNLSLSLNFTLKFPHCSDSGHLFLAGTPQKGSWTFSLPYTRRNIMSTQAVLWTECSLKIPRLKS